MTCHRGREGGARDDGGGWVSRPRDGRERSASDGTHGAGRTGMGERDASDEGGSGTTRPYGDGGTQLRRATTKVAPTGAGMDWGMGSRPYLSREQRRRGRGNDGGVGLRGNNANAGFERGKGGGNPVPTRGGRERNVDGQPQGLPQRGRAWIGGWIPVPVFTGQALRGNNGGGGARRKRREWARSASDEGGRHTCPYEGRGEGSAT